MYECRFFFGDYYHRQRDANRAGAVFYIEHHFNSDYKGVGNYCGVLIGHNASKKSEEVALLYAELISKEFDLQKGFNNGVKKLKRGERGDYNLRYTSMPAILVEPMFISNSNHIKMLFEEDGFNRLAKCLAETIKQSFPEGLIALSVGHKYKRTKPNDRGALVRGRPEYTEADISEWVLWKTKCILERG